MSDQQIKPETHTYGPTDEEIAAAYKAAEYSKISPMFGYVLIKGNRAFFISKGWVVNEQQTWNCHEMMPRNREVHNG